MKKGITPFECEELLHDNIFALCYLRAIPKAGKPMKVLKVAILGARGIPARYGGYDTLVEELALGLAKRGAIKVLVYCRSAYYDQRPGFFEGVQLVYLPSPRLKAVESLFHSLISALDVLRRAVDVILFVDPANAPFAALLRLFGKKVIVHTDGLGWKRRKWGPLGRRYYKGMEWLCARLATSLISDNLIMRDYYLGEYGAPSTYIPYGAADPAPADPMVYQEYGLCPHAYLLVVARLERENNTDFIIEEYVRSGLSLPLVVVGDAPYDPPYLARLHELADSRVIFTGRLHDQPKLNALYAGAYLYIHGHEVGGTNPSLLRAMGAGVAPLVIDLPFNTTVVAGAGFVFERRIGQLTKVLERLAASPTLVREAGLQAKFRAAADFRWEAVVADYEKLFSKVSHTS